MTPLQQQWQYYIQQSGMDPSYAMAVLSRESGFNPNMGGTGTIGGRLPDDAQAAP
jgi:soluble lytic murein transglycosylase-like protein